MGMEKPRKSWEDVKSELLEWGKGLPILSKLEMENLLASGLLLPALLERSDDQWRAEVDALVLAHRPGEGWPEMQASWKQLIWERYQWALAMVDALEGCRFPVPAHFSPASLLIEGWDCGGAAYTHDNFLRKYLREALQGEATRKDIVSNQ